ncbi:hypothetical protein G9U51_08235 [Calidifontibacter sp. DB0510]|uniref:Uncharacterized protein n=1 Tax=Metallococcus carri TaxID=1656884 RepID=A0A967AZX5_9MICO|nr:hypothetical protein [Metallococcus carri]NHN55756.1 hypothetical protein [Metallococcus carri]NHN55763.1 hypothetical protein [Metallococcus carri]NOP38548.1 hypothetical protein [Calidifontibacter sp. DB2511S]NOP38555.1 hypothetical protein [Calidifontibacter sp. DB2511S]
MIGGVDLEAYLLALGSAVAALGALLAVFSKTVRQFVTERREARKERVDTVRASLREQVAYHQGLADARSQELQQRDRLAYIHIAQDRQMYAALLQSNPAEAKRIGPPTPLFLSDSPTEPTT